MNIQAVARRTGVPAATLRKWEQRYGVLHPDRTPGSHRRYSERDVLRVEWLKARLGEGYRIGEAARLLGGDGHDEPASDPDALAALILEGARTTDPACIERGVEQALALLDIDVAVARVIEPALRRIGECWETGELSVGQEHAASDIVRARLRAVLDSSGDGARGRAVLTCAPGERHDIGLLALGVLLQSDGWGIVYLGADTPLPEAVAIAVSSGASLLCVSATLPSNAAPVADDLESLSTENGFGVLTGGLAFGGDSAVEARNLLRRRAAA